MYRSIPFYLIFLTFYWPFSLVIAQPVPDRSLGTTQERLGSDTLINGGTQKGSNLFQSFERFDVPAQESVTFTNPAGVERIFTRVTGTTASKIDGTLAVNGSADLLLINPNGISFGSDARLQLSGSFLGTTARTIEFEDGTALAISDPQPVLTMSAPVGLGLDGGGEIRLSGNGHDLVMTDFDPLDVFFEVAQTLNAGQSETGLIVPSGQRFSLVAGSINFDSAVVLAPEGQVDLVAVEDGFVSLDPNSDLSSVREFGDISLKNLALVDTSGRSGGKIFVDTGTLSLASGSHILNQSTEAVVGGDGEISVRASESISIAGISGPEPILIPPSQSQTVFSSIAAEAITGAIIPITIEAPSIQLIDGGAIASVGFESGIGDRISIQAEELTISGTSSAIPFPNFSFVFSYAAGTSEGSDIRINAESIDIFDGGNILATSLESASAGDIEVGAEAIQIRGVTEFFEGFEVGSRISSQNAFSPQSDTLEGSADSGKVDIFTSSLSVLEGGTINTSTSSSGSAGTISIEANEVTVTGVGGDTSIPSSISSSSIFVAPTPSSVDELLGNGGSISIDTNSILIDDRAFIGVSNLGQGQGGNIALIAEDVGLSGGNIVANAASDSGGAIFIDSSLLLLEDASMISVNSITGDAGSIVLDSFVIVEPGSQITADSVSGGLGTIDITDEFDINVEPTVPDFGPPAEAKLIAQKCTVEDHGRFVRTFHSEGSLAAQWILPKEAEGFEFDVDGNAILTGGDATLIASCRPQLQQEATQPSTLPQKS